MKILKKRRRQNKTDYKARINLLKSGTPRLVFRKTNRYFICQYVESSEAKDKIKLGVTSKELLNKGWPKEFSGSLKSIPSAYLLGYLMGKKIQKEKLKTPIIDFGMIRTLAKTKVFGFLKGLIDSGIKINCKEELFPEQKIIEGKELKKDFSEEFTKVKSNIDKI